MYDFLSGKIAVRKADHAVVDVNGVGYRVEIPLSTYEKLPREGTVKLYTYLRVTDDDLRLYGFFTEREREIFLKLVDSVQQLGPAKACTILSSVSPEALSRAIEAEDVAFLRNIKGIGEKIAHRLIVEMKGKLPSMAGKDGPGSSTSTEASGALIALGYDRRQAEEAVQRALKEFKSEPTVEDLIKRSLQHV